MGRAWDIIPPRPRHRKIDTKTKTKKSSSKGVFFFGLVVIIIIFAFFYQETKNHSANINGAATNVNTPLYKSPAIIDNSSGLNNNLNIKILNGSGLNEETVKVQKILNQAGLEVSKTESALNLYDQSIIYYQTDYEEKAKEIAKSLENYQPKIQKFSQETSYDIIIVIGAR